LTNVSEVFTASMALMVEAVSTSETSVISTRVHGVTPLKHGLAYSGTLELRFEHFSIFKFTVSHISAL
jgi:hypothetical protein